MLLHFTNVAFNASLVHFVMILLVCHACVAAWNYLTYRWNCAVTCSQYHFSFLIANVVA